MQHEPGVRAAFSDPAVGDDVLVPAQARIAVQLLELLIGLESAVIIGSLAPWHVDCSRDMTTTLRLLLRQVSGREQPAGVLVGAAHVDQALGANCSNHFVPEG